MTALAIVVVLVLPVAVTIALLHVANVVERRRTAAISQQVMLTDAIHAVLGPVVAPRVRRGRRGSWIAELAVPAGMPQIGVMLEIAQASLGPDAEIVLTTQEPPRQRRPSAPPALTFSGARFSR
jgi:hypothetical protein